VPWHGWQLAVILVFYVLAAMVAAGVAELRLGHELTRPLVIQDVAKSCAAHTVAKLLATVDVWTLIVAGLSAVVVAPVVEEFLFRTVLQGWLEKVERRLRPAMPTWRRCASRGAGPVLVTSFLFGWVHFRVAGPAMHIEYLAFMLTADALVKVVTMLFAIGLLRATAGATAADMGWAPERLRADVRLGLMAFAGLAAPIYALQVTLALLIPKYLAPDPFVLFFLALGLGTLYFRTHRLMPAIVLHAALNTTSLALLLAGGSS
jgi:membrane protease YdiL (CAAX protease family)